MRVREPYDSYTVQVQFGTHTVLEPSGPKPALEYLRTYCTRSGIIEIENTVLSEPFTVTAYQNLRTDIYETLSDKISGS